MMTMTMQITNGGERAIILGYTVFRHWETPEEGWKHFNLIAHSEMQMQCQHLHAWNSDLWTRHRSRLQCTKQQIHEAPSRQAPRLADISNACMPNCQLWTESQKE